MKKFLSLINKRLSVLLIVITMAFGAFFYYSYINQVLPQSMIFFLDDVNLPERGQRVLVFTPHPDDETIGAGGYIQESIARGAEVKIVMVTDGNKHGLKEKRYLEFIKATGILGVDQNNLVFLGFPDGGLNKSDQTSLTDKIRGQVDNFKPDYVLTTPAFDTHPDHAKVGEIVSGIVKSEDKKITTYQYLIHHNGYPQPKRFARDDYLLPPVRVVNFDDEWQRLMLPKNIEDKKTEAVDQYSSQLRVPILRSTILSLIRKNELFAIVK